MGYWHANVINVAIVGAHQSGKTSLRAIMNRRVIRRYLDLKSFELRVNEHGIDKEDADDISDTHCDFLVYLFSHEQGQSPEEAYYGHELFIHNLIRERPGLPLAVVGTKGDLIPTDLDPAYCSNLRLKPRCAYKNGVEYFCVSSATGHGLNDLYRYIVDTTHRTSPSYPCVAVKWARRCFLALTSSSLDAAAALFALPVPRDVNPDTPDTENFDNDAIHELLQAPIARAWDALPWPSLFTISLGPAAHKITPNLIVKNGRDKDERDNMIFVRQHTRIPVPQPRHRHLTRHLVMDFIEGQTLFDCWDNLGFLMQIRIACTLRTYISQLRLLRRDVPGTVATCTVGGVLFNDQRLGPFPSSTELRRYCEFGAYHGWASATVGCISQGLHSETLPPPPLGGHWPLCFVHGDLNLRNLILSQDRVLWVIDWAESGFLPPWLETIAIKNDPDAPASWKRFRWFVAGSWPSYEAFWDFFIDGTTGFLI